MRQNFSQRIDSAKDLDSNCGLRSSTRDASHRARNYNETKIYGGGDASSGEYPWMVMVQIFDGSVNRFCGGSLISTRWIVTTAFCVDGAQSTITDFQSFARYGSSLVASTQALT